MTTLRLAVPLLALATLSACVVPVPVPPGTPGSIMIDQGSPCGARGLQSLVGQDGAAVAGATFQSPGPVRVIRPGDAVTEEFIAERLNIRIGESGRVAAVDCG